MSRSNPREIHRVLLLGGTSEIGQATLRALPLAPGAEVVLAGRDTERLAETVRLLPEGVSSSITHFDALDPTSAAAVVRAAFDAGEVDVVIPAFGVLGERDVITPDPASTRDLLTVNVVAQAMAVVAAADALRAQGHGTVVVLSSIAAIRPRRANYVYGASKAALDALAQGLTDALHGTGVAVITVRPGFVIGRMTAGLRPAPFATTPDAVGSAVAHAITAGASTTVWVPTSLRVVAAAMRSVPRVFWRRQTR